MRKPELNKTSTKLNALVTAFSKGYMLLRLTIVMIVIFRESWPMHLTM